MKAVCALLLLILVLTGCGESVNKGEEQGGKQESPSAEKQSDDVENTETETGIPISDPEGTSRLQVVTTIFPQYDFARQIAGDRADVTMLLKPGEEVHSYEPTPQDIKTIQNSDLFIYVGGENDVWVENILDSVNENREGPQTVRLLDLVETYAEQHLEGMMEEKGHDHAHEEGDSEEEHDHAHAEEDSGEGYEHDHVEEDSGEGHDHETETEHAHEEEASAETEDVHAQDHIEEGHDHETETEHAHEEEASAETEDVHDHEEEVSAGTEHTHEHEEEVSAGTSHAHSHAEEPDEHVWTSPENCVILIGKLTDIFCEADPANAAAYRENGDAYRSDFEKLDAEYRAMAASSIRNTILFGDRFPFRYLAEELGLTCYAAFSGCSSESEPSAATIAFLIDKAAEEKLPVVFKIEFSNGNIARAICEAADLKMQKANKIAAEQAEDLSGEADSSGDPELSEESIKVLQLHSCHNLTRDEFKAGETCLSLMTGNLEALREALGAQR